MDAMVTGLQSAHSVWRYVVLISAVLAAGMMWRGWFSAKPWSSVEMRMANFFVVVLDLEVVLGIFTWLLNQQWTSGEILSTWRHPVLMLTIWLFVRIGWYRLRHAAKDRDKFRIGAIWFTSAFFFVIVGVLQISRMI